MSKNIIAIIVKDGKDLLISKDKKYISQIDEMLDDNTSLIFVTKQFENFEILDKDIIFLVIKKLEQIEITNNSKYVSLLVNAIIEFSLYEYANNIKIYQSLEDFLNKNYIEFEIYPDKLPIEIIYNPVDFLIRQENNFFKLLSSYFKELITKEKLIQNYKYAKINCHPIINKNIKNDTKSVFFYWTIETSKLFYIFQRKFGAFSLKYIALTRFVSFRDYFSIQAYLLIPESFKMFIKYLIKIIIFRNKKEFKPNNNFIITNSFRKKLLVFKYFNAFSKQFNEELKVRTKNIFLKNK